MIIYRVMKMWSNDWVCDSSKYSDTLHQSRILESINNDPSASQQRIIYI